jgi:hypothetical protein
MTRTKNQLIGATVFALTIASCGGGTSADTPSTTEPGTAGTDAGEQSATTTQAAAGSTTAPADEPESSGEPSSNLAVNTAVATIGDYHYEFDVTPGTFSRCDPDFFGAFWAAGSTADGSGGVELLLTPPNDPNHTDLPRVKVKDGPNDLEWHADPDSNIVTLAELPEGTIKVDSFTVEGNAASGTATFVEANATYAYTGGQSPAPTPVQGTFEVVCAPAG